MTQSTDTTTNAGGHVAHPPHLAHHFDTPEQQFESAKFGMWAFLATEVLMFGGLFCAYSVYRGNHPETFLYGHIFLNKQWGAINTIILLASSFTMAWGVRAAQLGQQKLLVWMLVLTFLGGVGFMGIKTIEYGGKVKHKLFVGAFNAFYYKAGSPLDPDKLKEAIEYGQAHHAEHAGPAHGVDHGDGAAADASHDPGGHVEVGPAAVTAAAEAAPGTTVDLAHGAEADDAKTSSPAPPADRSLILPAAIGPTGVAPQFLTGPIQPGGHGSGGNSGGKPGDGHRQLSYDELPPVQQERVHVFFQIYFLMTGLHGFHVLIGMGLLAYLAIRAARGAFGPAYFTPVDLIGLYWHLVDLIWIFLFPLLYLIH